MKKLVINKNILGALCLWFGVLAPSAFAGDCDLSMSREINGGEETIRYRSDAREGESTHWTLIQGGRVSGRMLAIRSVDRSVDLTMNGGRGWLRFLTDSAWSDAPQLSEVHFVAQPMEPLKTFDMKECRDRCDRVAPGNQMCYPTCERLEVRWPDFQAAYWRSEIQVGGQKYIGTILKSCLEK